MARYQNEEDEEDEEEKGLCNFDTQHSITGEHKHL